MHDAADEAAELAAKFPPDLEYQGRLMVELGLKAK
jgi:hypothetical protein